MMEDFSLWNECYAKAFTLADGMTLDTIKEVSELLFRSFQEGDSFEQFRTRLIEWLPLRKMGVLHAGSVEGRLNGASDLLAFLRERYGDDEGSVINILVIALVSVAGVKGARDLLGF